MAFRSSFFNSVNGDRRYLAFRFAEFFASFIGNGVFPNPSTGLQVVADGTNMTVKVRPGQGWINGYFAVNDSDYTLQHDVADGVLKRIDRVVLRLDFLKREIVTVIKKGTFASTPVAPVLQRNADAYELALADVLINNGATNITQVRITDQRLNTALCGIVHGVVDQVDTTTIFNQYQAWFGDFTTDKQVEFDAWMESLEDILSGDVAGNLAARINGVESGLATHRADYVSHPANGGTSAGTATAYTCNSSPNPSSLVDKIGIVITAHIDSGANPTLKWGSLAAKSIRKSNGSAASFKKDGLYTLRYNSVNDSFILQGEGGEEGAIIKSVQRGAAILSSTSLLVNISAIDITKSFIKFTYTSDSGSVTHTVPSAYFSSNSQITFTKGASAGISTTIEWEVVEFVGGVSIQTGTVNLNSPTTNQLINISSVDASKTMLFVNYHPTLSPSTSAAWLTIKLNTPTQLSLTRLASDGNLLNVRWTVVEFI